MIYNIQNFFANQTAKRKEKKKREARDRGFGWAMTAYYREKICLDEIEMHVYGFDINDFDRGAYEAISIIKACKQLGLKQLLIGK